MLNVTFSEEMTTKEVPIQDGIGSEKTEKAKQRIRISISIVKTERRNMAIYEVKDTKLTNGTVWSKKGRNEI